MAITPVREIKIYIRNNPQHRISHLHVPNPNSFTPSQGAWTTVGSRSLIPHQCFAYFKIFEASFINI